MRRFPLSVLSPDVFLPRDALHHLFFIIAPSYPLCSANQKWKLFNINIDGLLRETTRAVIFKKRGLVHDWRAGGASGAARWEERCRGGQR